MKIFIEIGTVTKVLALKDRKILMIKEFNSDVNLFNELFGMLVTREVTEINFSHRMYYVKGKRQPGMFPINQINTVDDERLLGVYKGKDIKLMQNLTKAIGLGKFNLINNIQVYKTLSKSTDNIFLDEFLSGSYVVAPIYKGRLATHLVAYENTIEDVTFMIAKKVNVTSFVNMLNTDIGKLEHVSYYSNLDVINSKDVQKLAYLLTLPLVTKSNEITIEQQINTSVIELPEEEERSIVNLKKEMKNAGKKENSEEDEEGSKTIVGTITNILSVIVVIILCLSYTVNGKIMEDIALVQTVSARAESERAFMYQQKELLNHLGMVRNKETADYAEIFFRLSKVETISSFTRLTREGEGFIMEYLVNTEEDALTLIEELTRVINIDGQDIIYEQGSDAYRVVARSNF